MENEHTEMRSIASAKEHEIITTNPDEILEKSHEIIAEPLKKVDIKLDENKGYFKKSALNQDEIDFLLNKKYIVSSHVPLGGGRQETYFLKPSKRETPTHFFLVKALEEYALQFTKDVKCYETLKPDIIFKAGKKRIAIEVETGCVIQKSEQMKNKISLLKKYDGWFFVVTDSRYIYLYEALGKTCTRRDACEQIRKYFK